MDTSRINKTLQILATKTATQENARLQAERKRQERNAKAIQDHDAQLSHKIQTILKNRLEGRSKGLKHSTNPKTKENVYTIDIWIIGRVWGSVDTLEQQTQNFLQGHGLQVQQLQIQEVFSNNYQPPEWFGTGHDDCVQLFWILMTGGIPLVTRPLAAITDFLIPRLKIRVVVTKGP